MSPTETFNRELQEAREYADRIINARFAVMRTSGEEGVNTMASNEYDDSRVQDGQDEREQRRANREAYDLETINRYDNLIARYTHQRLLPQVDFSLVTSINLDLTRDLTHLLDKEGF